MSDKPPSIDITGMSYDEAVKHLQKVTPWTTSMIMNYVAVVLELSKGCVEETNEHASKAA